MFRNKNPNLFLTCSSEWFSWDKEFVTPSELEVFRLFAGGAATVSWSGYDDIYCTHQTIRRCLLYSILSWWFAAVFVKPPQRVWPKENGKLRLETDVFQRDSPGSWGRKRKGNEWPGLIKLCNHAASDSLLLTSQYLISYPGFSFLFFVLFSTLFTQFFFSPIMLFLTLCFAE